MKIFVNGCSHTQGTNVSLPVLEDGYPYVLERDYGIPTVTKAQCGSSNDRIFRSTVSHIIENPHYTHAFIQWTYQDRFESPANPENIASISRCYDDYTQHYPQSDAERLGLEKHLAKDQRYFYKMFYDQSDSATRDRCHDKLHTQMLTLDSFLESRDIIPVHSMWIPVGGSSDSKLKKTLKNELNFLFDPEIGMETMLISHGYEYCGQPRQDGRGPDMHFMKDAHKKMAEWVYQYLKTREQIKTPKAILTQSWDEDPANHVYNIEDL